jgi:flavin reductase (DIM6/NTAB) family NADH-FMN oxidoreductase RutF/DNA-binding GntR family transcriptional regulator
MEVQVRKPLTADEFREVIGRFASGVAVVTALHDGAAHGTTASAVTSLSLEPPMLVVCMNRESATGRAMKAARRFAVNVLSEDQADIADRFATKGGDKFAGTGHTSGAWGEPLLDEALATMECQVVDEIAGGTHWVFIAEVDRASARPGAPLAYFRGQFGRLELARDQRAVGELRTRVLHGDLPIGTSLDLDALAAELGAPRNSVYHALSRLTGEGIVARDEAGAFVVPPLTYELVDDALRARGAIVLGAAVIGVGQVTEDEAAEFRRLALAIYANAEAGRDTWLADVGAFRRYVVQLSRSRILLESYDRASLPLTAITLRYGGLWPPEGSRERANAAYMELVDAYASGDLRAAIDVIQRLLDISNASTRAAFAAETEG